jgi:hypothetical protein
MRLTCLRCGHQAELASAGAGIARTCVCGSALRNPGVIDTGIKPSERLAERLRYRAFRAAGVVTNLGGFALCLTLLGALCFPLALAGAVLGAYVAFGLRAPLARYSGRRLALWAWVLGTLIFVGESWFAWRWLAERRLHRQATLQAGAVHDLRRLMREQTRLHAEHDRYGGFAELAFASSLGTYTIYLSASEVYPAQGGMLPRITDLPADIHPMLSPDAFTAVAVRNLDDDAELDIWTLQSDGTIAHPHDDLARE